MPEAEQTQKSVKYSPLNSEQIRYEYRQRDRSQLRFFQFCGNVAHIIATFAQAEGVLHFDSIGIILILLFFINFCCGTGLPSVGPRMDSVIIHILLLFIQLDDGKI